jgi:hypothetical protein
MNLRSALVSLRRHTLRIEDRIDFLSERSGDEIASGAAAA